MSPEGVFDHGQVRVLAKIGGVWGAKDGWGPSVFKTEPTWFLGRLVLPDAHMGGLCFFLQKWWDTLRGASPSAVSIST